MGKSTHFALLLWKNWILQKRKVLVTLLEIGLPTFFALILIFIRMRVTATEVNYSRTWDSYEIDEFPMICPGGRSPGSSCGEKWQLFYSPNNSLTTSLMKQLRGHMHFHFKKVVGFPEEGPMVDKIVELLELESENQTYHCDVFGAVVFSNLNVTDDSLPAHVSYKIRLPSQNRDKINMGSSTPNQHMDWQTRFMFPIFQRIGPRSVNNTRGGNPDYFIQGFLTLQNRLDEVVFEAQTGKTKNDFHVHLQRMPYPPYNDDNFVLVLQNQFPFILLLSFIFSALYIVKDVVYEKEMKLKESMKMMGMNNYLHWLAWFVKYFLFLLISITIMTVFFCIPVGKYGSVIGHTNPLVLLVFLLVYATSVICFSFMVSVFFTRANSAAAAAGILFFMTYIPYFFLQPRYDTLSWGAKIGASLISNVAMAFGGQVIGMFEGTGAGIQWSNIAQGASVDDNFSMLNVIVMLLLDSMLYLIVMWYVEAVAPGEYGIPQPWYFPVTKSYWCGVRASEEDPGDLETSPLLLRRASGDSSSSSGYFERDPTGIKAGIKIKKLGKEFGSGSAAKVAVNDISLNIYEGQITALLGHNGAGKTTTMSMLTGFIPPSSGTAIVNGYNIREDIASVRESLGLCPQHDVLFDSLTVHEHLVFFAKLKGCKGDAVHAEVDDMLDSVGLTLKRHALAKTLSGGQKRKLSVGIALIGGSKIVMLDEPTSGMDPNARRQTWDILQKHREGRTMILTTHFMDEADVLGDRIAIMANGNLQCCGTPLFLKNKYGAGYHMVMVKENGCDVEEVTSVVQRHVPDARLESNVSAELSYVLPHEGKSAFPAMFTEIENRKTELKIASYGASVTTMEEVFLRVGELGDEGLQDKLNPDGDSGGSYFRNSQGSCINAPLFNRDVVKNTGASLYLQQFYGMFIKRALHTSRNLLVTLAQLAVPLFFTILALIVIKTLPGPEDSPSLSLDLSHFMDNYVTYSAGTKETESDITRQVAASYAKQFNNHTTSLKFIDNNTTYEQYMIDIGIGRISSYSQQYIIGAEFNHQTNGNVTEINATAHFNAQTYHGQPITLNAVNNGYLRYASGDRNLSTSATNHPLPRTINEEVNQQLTSAFEGFTIAINLLFGFSFLASSFVLFLIKERAGKAKHSQYVSGVHSLTFWSSTFVWDFINYLLPCILLLVAFAGFSVTAYVGDLRFFMILLLFVLYGWAVLPFMYNLSFIFKVPSSGLVWLTMLNILAGIATVLAVQILKIPQLDTMDIARGLEWTFLVLLPNFCLGQAMLEFYNNHEYLKICERPEIQAACAFKLYPNPCCKDWECGPSGCLDYQDNYLSWEAGGIGRMLVFLGVQGLLYFFILLIIESGVFQRCLYYVSPKSRRQSSHDNALVAEDGDVARERMRIQDTPAETLCWTDSLILQELSKDYGRLRAVDRLSVGIPQGECFGLLGINGAGKTSTFMMLTGDESVTEGNAYLDGHDIKNNIKKVRQQLGYCPQFDALIDQLTGRETLTMFARLRGVKENLIKSVVSDLISALLLDKHADKQVQELSGGNKRKLSTAIALVGDPPVVFLDEPSTGMDPVARRLLWDTLSQVRASGRTLVLTSHSMEECEALCTRIAIMVNGQFRCLGSPQHLKNKFGEGFTLIARVGHSAGAAPPDVTSLMNYVTTKFPGSVLKDVHQGMVHYHITDTTISWSELFGAMESAKQQYNIEDYLVSQTTLEQVFINFARAQIPPQEKRAGLCTTCAGACCYLLCCRCCCGCNTHQEMEPLVIDGEEEVRENEAFPRV